MAADDNGRTILGAGARIARDALPLGHPHSLSDRKFNRHLPDFRHTPVADVMLDSLSPVLRAVDQADAMARSA